MDFQNSLILTRHANHIRVSHQIIIAGTFVVALVAVSPHTTNHSLASLFATPTDANLGFFAGLTR